MAHLDIDFVTRGNELDGEGLVPPHMILRYMENMRWEPSELVNIFRAGNSYVVVAQTLRIMEDIGVGEHIRGTSWIGRVGRTSLEFHHAFERIKDSRLLAAGSTTFVCLDSDGGVPVPLPDQVRALESDSPVKIELDPLKIADAPENAFSCPYHIRLGDIDFLGHMNQASYAALYDDARQTAASRHAYGPEAIGLGRMRVLRIEYIRSALMGDEVSIETWLSQTDPVTLGFVMRRGSTLLSRAIAHISHKASTAAT